LSSLLVTERKPDFIFIFLITNNLCSNFTLRRLQVLVDFFLVAEKMPNEIENRFAQSIEAIENLLLPELRDFFQAGWNDALAAHSEIKIRPIAQKTIPFYRYFVQSQLKLAAILTSSYRRYFKLALAQPQLIASGPHEWASQQFASVVDLISEWIRDWFSLACDGSNQHMQLIASVPFELEQTVTIPLKPVESSTAVNWLAPAWLFQVGAIVGIAFLRTEHVPDRNTEEKLSTAHTRLLLKGARKVFLFKLRTEFERVSNEELALAGTNPAHPTTVQPRQYKRKGLPDKLKLYGVMQKILADNPSLEGKDFCVELDRRHVRAAQGSCWRRSNTRSQMSVELTQWKIPIQWQS
jgi:hypothetical protein